MTIGTIRQKCVRAANAAASDLLILAGSMTMRLSRAMISNRPIPAGVDGIDAPMLVIAVILAADEKTSLQEHQTKH